MNVIGFLKAIPTAAQIVNIALSNGNVLYYETDWTYYRHFCGSANEYHLHSDEKSKDSDAYKNIKELIISQGGMLFEHGDEKSKVHHDEIKAGFMSKFGTLFRDIDWISEDPN